MANLSQLLLALAVAGWIGGFGLASARAAARVERRPSLWFTIGAVAGPVALLVLRAAPPGRCRTCGAPTRGWHRTCWWCLEDVRSTPVSTRAILERMAARATPDAAPTPPAEPSAPARPFVIRTDPVRTPVATAPEVPQRPVPARVASAPNPRAATAPPVASPGAGRQGHREPRIVPAAEPSAVVGAAAQRSGSSASVDPSAAPRPSPLVRPSNEALQVLATAIFVAGGAGLEPGHRYGLALRSNRFQVVGPIDVDPTAIVVDRAVADVEVRTVEGRLIVSEPANRSGLVLAFMSVAGPAPSELAAGINAAARAAGGG